MVQAMVQAIVEAMVQISSEVNQVLNIVKAKFDLKDKSHAIEKVVLDYGEDFLEPELRPEFIQKMKRIEKGPKVKFKNMDEFDKRFELK